MNRFYLVYLLAMALVVGSILITPMLALHGPKDVAAALYNVYVPTCHQWIYRSSCIFFDGQNHRLGDCIEKGTAPLITTEFTNASHAWDGPFAYSRDQIGLNRAERVEYAQAVGAGSAPRGTVGYKFPNDTRNIGIYLSMLLAGIALPFAWKNPRMPHFLFLLLGFLPVAIDGGGQMMGWWESTSPVRFATGLVMGATVSIFLYSMLYETRGRPAAKRAGE